MSTESKIHHFNPQHILRNFLLDGEHCLQVLDKEKERVFPCPVKAAGQEKHFNTVSVEGERVNLEHVFQDIDAAQSVLIREVVSQRSIDFLSQEEVELLAHLMVVQMLRVKSIRQSLESFPAQMEDHLKDLGVDTPTVQSIDENESRIQSFSILAKCDQHTKHVVDKDIILFVAPAGRWFWTSDNPIWIYNEFGTNDIGLACKGVRINWPIAKDLLISFACPSICNKIDHSDPKLAQFFRNKPTVACTPSQIAMYNLSQLSNCTRFVYAPSNNYTDAMEHLKRHPRMKGSKSFLRVGLPTRSSGDDTETLMVFGASTVYRCEVESIDDRGLEITVKVKTNAEKELKHALSDSPHSEIRIMEGNNERHVMRNVEIQPNSNDPLVVDIRHAWPDLR